MYDITIFKMVIVFKISKDIKIHTYIEQHSRQQWNLSFSVIHPIYSSPGYNPLPRYIYVYTNPSNIFISWLKSST